MSTKQHPSHITPMPTANEHAAAASFAILESKLSYINSSGVASIKSAYRFADEAHLGQMRKNGEPYITHPIAVASLCANWKLDVNAIMAALLHDTMEDCGISKQEMFEHFGTTVAELVDGLTKLDRVKFNSREESQAESFRKMLLAMARDVRVILIKIADRLHNMRTLSDMPAPKRRRIASETLEVYAPIAHRLGLNSIYREFQNLAFSHLKPWRYGILNKALNKARKNRSNFVQSIEEKVKAAFEKINMKVDLDGREKTIYSIYCKMVEKKLSYSEVHDIFGFRILVEDLLDCYTAIGVLHQTFQPIPGKFKDHIAIPKINGYQSLHTVVMGPAGVVIEFQTRTSAMHLISESGLAAHWIYKAKTSGVNDNEQISASWLQSLLRIQEETLDSNEFWDHVKVDLFPDAIYVLTPKNRILALPRGATALDFAYAIHSNIGDHAIGARVNDVPAALRSELHNGEVVEVVTSAASAPSPAWLDFVRTGRARSRIRHYLKTQSQTTSVQLGEKLLTQAVRAEGIIKLPDRNDAFFGEVWDKVLRFTGSKNYAELLSDIGLGKRLASIVAKKLSELLLEKGQHRDLLLLSNNLLRGNVNNAPMAIVLDGNENSYLQYAVCCRPVPGDAVLGYLGRGEGLVVHTANCAVVQQQQHRHPERFTPVEWSDDIKRSFVAGINVTCVNKRGAIAMIAAIISKQEGDIVHIEMDNQLQTESNSILKILIMVRDKLHLETIIIKLQRTHAIHAVTRI